VKQLEEIFCYGINGTKPEIQEGNSLSDSSRARKVVTNIGELYENYVDLIRVPEKSWGSDPGAVLESLVIQLIESMKGTDRPISELEIKRKEWMFKEPLQANVQTLSDV
jgi:hypothetical protein